MDMDDLDMPPRDVNNSFDMPPMQTPASQPANILPSSNSTLTETRTASGVSRADCAQYLSEDVNGHQLPTERAAKMAVRAAVGVVVVVCVYMVYDTLFADEVSTGYDESDDETIKLKRQQMRGTVASILNSLTLGTLNFLIDKYGDVNAATSTALIGLCYGGTLGFVMDNAIGSDRGWKTFQTEGSMAAWKYGLGTIMTPSYVRYVVTVLLDTFVSLILFKPLFSIMCTLPYFRDGNEALANGITSTLIGIVTFQAYANVTRFSWAYPSTSSQSNGTWINGGVMQVIVSLASVVFLISDTRIREDEEGINSPNVKLCIVLVALLMLWYLASTGTMEPKLDMEVVPDNLFLVTSSETLKEGDVVSSETLTIVQGEKRGSLQHENAEFKVVRVHATHTPPKYTVRRETPAFRYRAHENISIDEVMDNGLYGSAVLVCLAGIAGGATILGTSKVDRQMQKKLLGAFMAFATLCASPGLVA